MRQPEHIQPRIHPARHGVVEDSLALLVGSFLVSVGLFILQSADALTGGTAGLSLLLSYVVPAPFTVVFILVNVPFIVLAVRQKGWNFTLRTALSLALTSTFVILHPIYLPLASGVNVFYAAALGNVLCGVGVLVLFRHTSSLGGFNVVGLVLQQRTGFRAGFTLMILDLVVVLASFAVVPPMTALVSALGVAVLNVIIALNHVPGRYLGSSATS